MSYSFCCVIKQYFKHPLLKKSQITNMNRKYFFPYEDYFK